MSELMKKVAQNEYFEMYEGETTKQLTKYCVDPTLHDWPALEDVKVLRVIPKPQFDTDEYNDCYVMYKGKKAIFHGTYSEIVAEIEKRRLLLKHGG